MDLFIEISEKSKERLIQNPSLVLWTMTDGKGLKKGEIGHIIDEEGNKLRYILKKEKKTQNQERDKMAHFFHKQFPLIFVDYRSYRGVEPSKNEIGRMFGCRILLK